MLRVEAHFKSSGAHGTSTWAHRDWSIGPPERAGELGAPVLRASRAAVTGRTHRGTKAISRRERRACGIDPALPGCGIHASRDPCATRDWRAERWATDAPR